MNKIFKDYKITLLMGSIWGLTELIFGYALHIITIPVAGALLLPAGVMCMYFTWRATSSPFKTFFTSIIAALFKLVTFVVLPVGASHLVINPVAAILLQGIFMIVPLIAIFRLRESLFRWYYPVIVLVTFSSIFLYKAAFILFQNYLNYLNGSPVLAGLNISANISLFFTETFISTVIFIIFLMVSRLRSVKHVIAASLLLFASTGALAQTSLPSLYAKNLEGKEVKLTDFLKEGRPVVISFWATWCKPCTEELDAISEKFDTWNEAVDFKFIAISVDDSRSSSKVRSFVSGRECPFTVLLDSNQEIMKAMNITSVPFTLILDKNGVVRYSHSGYIPGDENTLILEIKKISDEK
ncbi:MAG: TlpA family protein disulfide reductase [Bacteroidales bacterium]